MVEIASADEHSACVTRKGRIYMVGSNQHQKLGLEGISILKTEPKFLHVNLLSSYKIVKVACSFFHTMALTDDGRIFTWGGTLHGKSGLGEEH